MENGMILYRVTFKCDETGKTIAGTADGMRQNWEQFQEAEQSVDPREEEESHDGDDD